MAEKEIDGNYFFENFRIDLESEKIYYNESLYTHTKGKSKHAMALLLERILLRAYRKDTRLKTSLEILSADNITKYKVLSIMNDGPWKNDPVMYDNSFYATSILGKNEISFDSDSLEIELRYRGITVLTISEGYNCINILRDYKNNLIKIISEENKRLHERILKNVQFMESL